MLNHLRQPHRDDEGFTLIELMVVVLIMGILMAIAIPTFLSTTKSAKNVAGQSNATNAATTEIAYYASNTTFVSSANAGSSAVTGANLDPALPWDVTVTDTSAAPGTVFVETGTAWGAGMWATTATSAGGIMLLESQPKSSTQCYVVLDDQVSTAPEVGYYVYKGLCSAIVAPVAALAVGTPAAGSASAGTGPSATWPPTGGWAGFYNTF